MFALWFPINKNQTCWDWESVLTTTSNSVPQHFPQEFTVLAESHGYNSCNTVFLNFISFVIVFCVDGFETPVSLWGGRQISDKYTVTYWGFYSRWKFISVPKSQHTTVKYTQPFSKHTSGVYTQRCPHKTPSTGPLLVISQHELTFLQSESLHTHMRLSQFPNTN
jgi:hypothetical protein